MWRETDFRNIFGFTPLRNRKEDIIPCLISFLPQEVTKQEKVQELLNRLKPNLLDHDWYGNVRELQSVAERISLFAESDLDAQNGDFLFWGLFSKEKQHISERQAGKPIAQTGLKKMVEEYEERLIQEVLAQCEGNQSKAAEILKISKATLWRKLAK